MYLFDIVEYYKTSDFLHRKVFRILENMVKARNEDISEIIRYLIEDTPLIPFLINNKPKLIINATAVSESATEDIKKSNEDGTKSPEQSASGEEPLFKKVDLKTLQILSSSGLTAYSRQLASLLHSYYIKEKNSSSDSQSEQKLQNNNSS